MGMGYDGPAVDSVAKPLPVGKRRPALQLRTAQHKWRNVLGAGIYIVRQSTRTPTRLDHDILAMQQQVQVAVERKQLDATDQPMRCELPMLSADVQRAGAV